MSAAGPGTGGGAHAPLDGPLRVMVAGPDGHAKSALAECLSGAVRRAHALVEARDQGAVLENAAHGAAGAEAAILVVDAHAGFAGEARGYAYLLHLLGVPLVAVAVAEADAAEFEAPRFAEIARDVAGYLERMGMAPAPVVPVSLGDGGNVSQRSDRMAWYDGPSVLEALDGARGVSAPSDQPLRFPVEEVDKVEGRRVLLGRVRCGVLRLGERLLFLPSNKVARVRSIAASGDGSPRTEAAAGEPVGVTLDEPLLIERGEVASHEAHPPRLTTVFRASLLWLGRAPLELGRGYHVKLATQGGAVTVQSIEGVVDIETLAKRPGNRVEGYAGAEVVLRSRRVLALDEHRDLARCGRCILLDDGGIVAGGVVSMEGYPDQRRALEVRATNVSNVEHRVAAASRAQRNGHHGGVLWFTGLSGAGKSTLAMEVEQHLFRKGYHVYVLDGDNVRRGLNVNLGFSPEERAENIRRVGEVAALFADAGFICISAFISPYRADRHRARRSAGEAFHEIFIDADLETCERRDPKGLYKRARAGEIRDFTGVSAPYEPPSHAELTVDTVNRSVEECVAQILDYVDSTFVLAPPGRGERAERRDTERAPANGG